MAKPNPASPLVVAANAVHEEVRSYADLAAEAKRISLDSEKSLAKVSRLLEDATGRQGRVQEKVRALVSEIESIRVLQEQSLGALAEVARALEARAARFQALMQRFVALGERAKETNTLMTALAAKKESGAAEADLLEGFHDVEVSIDHVVADSEELSRDAGEDDWPEISRQADAIRQQVRAAKNRLTLAHRAIAGRAPS
jgi:hypothetical protein